MSATVWGSESPRKKERSYVGGGTKFDPYYDRCLDMQQQIRPGAPAEATKPTASLTSEHYEISPESSSG
jgi:hypothetical protein